ncbi:MULTISPECIES: NPCBM/NEW2 domain-containing protein [Paenibacillus]|uniref:Glycosyl hydrolase family 98 putative carbohydrate-binding module domain-containing protein n=1 Tax=Paenibacillus albilobatus TaxID=2716884 RepID=A0A919XE81_9BACL|nr:MULTISPECIES: NPCBM/NEW2 domain-containing protein [Paenibacillus]GIO29385.1 hypothetical protein J2TS6_05260 [Paenibacillus albilobatus]
MSYLSKIKYAICGFVAGAMFFGSIGFAASTSQSIQVYMQKVFFRINGVDKTTADGTFNNNGTNVPASFMYKGTNYLPMRMVAEMLGKEVQWDGKNSTVIVGGDKGDVDVLSKLSPTRLFDTSDLYEYRSINKTMKLQGQSYNTGLQVCYLSEKPTTQEYDLNGRYKKLTFNFGADDALYDSWNGTHEGASKLTVLGDGKELWSGIATTGVPQKDVSIEVSGVLKLSLVIQKFGDKYPAVVDIVNPILYYK